MARARKRAVRVLLSSNIVENICKLTGRHQEGNCRQYCSPSGKPLGLQTCTHPPKDKRKERAMREKEREESTKGKGGLYEMPQIPTLPPKWPRSGVTFHYSFNKILLSNMCLRVIWHIIITYLILDSLGFLLKIFRQSSVKIPPTKKYFK